MSDSGFTFSSDDFRSLARDALERARKSGASACEVELSEGFGLELTVRRDALDTLEHNRDKSLALTVYLGDKSGQANTSDFSAAAIEATVQAALSIARFIAPDPCNGLAEEKMLARSVPELALYHPWRPDVEQATALAREVEQAAFASDARISNSGGASVSSQEGHFMLATSAGFMNGYASSRHSVSCEMIAGREEHMQREFWYDSRRAASDLEAAADIGRIAGERACARLGARKIDTCTVPVLFAAPVAVTLLGNFAYAVSGGALYRKSSFLLDSLGEAIFPPGFSIVDDPGIARGHGSVPFDDEGVAVARREIIRDGRLQNYLLSSYSARKLGLETTGNAGGSHNLLVAGGEEDFAGLLRTMQRGLVVTELLGSGVNYVTGDYSRGVAGFWVEGGEIAWPVEEITIAGNLRQMFRQIVAVGNDALPRGAKQCGSVLIESMKVAGA